MSRLFVWSDTRNEEDAYSLYRSLKSGDWIRTETGSFQGAYLTPWATVQDPHVFTWFPHFASLVRCWQPSTPGGRGRSWEPMSNLPPV